MKSLLTPLQTSRLRRAASTLIMLTLTTLFSTLLSISKENVAMLYLLCVVSVCAVTGSFFCGLAAALGSVYLYNLIFLPPVWEIRLVQMDHFLTIVIFLVASLISGWMTSQLRRRVWQEEENVRRARLVAEMGQKYLKLQGQADSGETDAAGSLSADRRAERSLSDRGREIGAPSVLSRRI